MLMTTGNNHYKKQESCRFFIKKIKVLKMKELLKQRIERDIDRKQYNYMNDLLFKFVFGKEERKEITIDFLNAALERSGEDEIKDITFKNTELSAQALKDKSVRLDVFCITQRGEKVDVEVQLSNQYNMEKRTLFYWALMYIDGHKQGEDYAKLKPAITINLLNFTIFENAPVHSMYAVYNEDMKQRLNNDLELHFFEINKFQKKPIEEMTRIERWLAYFSNKLNAKELEELGMVEPMIQNAIKASDKFMDNMDERLAYINREMAIMDEISNREGSLKEGFEKGFDQAVNRIITNMIQAGLDDSQIAKFTNQSLKKIQQVREALRKEK